MRPVAIAMPIDGSGTGAVVPTSATAPVPGAANPTVVATGPVEGPHPTIQAPENAFKAIDKNGDGKLTPEEFCGGVPDTGATTTPAPLEPTRSPDVVGGVSKITLPADGKNGSALFEEKPGVDEGKKIVGALTTSTQVLDKRGGTAVAAKLTDLKDGQKVNFWIPKDSACAESYPEQCGADVVEILADK